MPLGACVCTHMRVYVHTHVYTELLLHFSIFSSTRKNFREPLHPSPGSTRRATCARAHAHACTLVHTPESGCALGRPYLGLAGNWSLGNFRPRLWHKTLFLLLFIQGNRKPGGVQPQKSGFGSTCPVRSRARPGGSCHELWTAQDRRPGPRRPHFTLVLLPESWATLRTSSHEGASEVTWPSGPNLADCRWLVKSSVGSRPTPPPGIR